MVVAVVRSAPAVSVLQREQAAPPSRPAERLAVAAAPRVVQSAA
jgi:hypothetical protein